MSTRVRTRFAPSPTGNLHIGGARTALFSYLWAKHNEGDFILRIEDTDKTREVPGSQQVIEEGLRWLGIEWDEGPGKEGEYGPYIQSQRTALYQEYVQQLVDAGKAYYCFCTAERLTEMRELQKAQKLPPRYDRHCRRLDSSLIKKSIQDNIPYVIRMAVPEVEGTIIVQDAIRGELRFRYSDIDDQVLMKSDGYPTYHLANVIDDHLMEISHVIRAEEWLPSTPKHVLLYQAFGWQPPVFAHLTVFLSKNGGKMSKRDGETSLLAFRDLGYLPESVVNFSALLGWNPKTEEEFFSMEELIQRFELSQINKGNPVFETEKLIWMNHKYIQELTVGQFISRLQEFPSEVKMNNKIVQFIEWFTTLDHKRQLSVFLSLKERLKLLVDVREVVEILEGTGEYDPTMVIWKKGTSESTIQALNALVLQLEVIEDEQYTAQELQDRIMPWIQESEWGNGDVLWPMRFALSGKQKSPSPFELAEILGKEEVLNRIQFALQELKKM